MAMDKKFITTVLHPEMEKLRKRAEKAEEELQFSEQMINALQKQVEAESEATEHLRKQLRKVQDKIQGSPVPASLGSRDEDRIALEKLGERLRKAMQTVADSEEEIRELKLNLDASNKALEVTSA
eukprot:gene27291-33610_t